MKQQVLDALKFMIVLKGKPSPMAVLLAAQYLCPEEWFGYAPVITEQQIMELYTKEVLRVLSPE